MTCLQYRTQWTYTKGILENYVGVIRTLLAIIYMKTESVIAIQKFEKNETQVTEAIFWICSMKQVVFAIGMIVGNQRWQCVILNLLVFSVAALLITHPTQFLLWGFLIFSTAIFQHMYKLILENLSPFPTFSKIDDNFFLVFCGTKIRNTVSALNELRARKPFRKSF